MSIITISRGTFSGGQFLAHTLAEQLGYECVSRETLAESVPWYGVSAGQLAIPEGEPSTLWGDAGSERTAYLMTIRAALCERAPEGNLVYHGHAGYLLLPDISHVIRVRAIADMEYRVKAAMKQQRLSRQDAQQYVERVDAERARWTRFLYGVEWDDPSQYDVVLNLSHMTLGAACAVVVRLTEMEEFKPRADSLRAMENLRLASRVQAALARDPRTKTADLTALADGGIVIISGSATDQVATAAAIELARQIPGATDVRTIIEVRAK